MPKTPKPQFAIVRLSDDGPEGVIGPFATFEAARNYATKTNPRGRLGIEARDWTVTGLTPPVLEPGHFPG